MNRTAYHVEKMDCAAEERLVRMALADVPGVGPLRFDLPARRVVVVHQGDAAPVTDALTGLGLGARPSGETESATEADLVPETTGTEERGPLRIALGINATFFVVEFAAGLVSGSMGLVADSLDNLADALVYALSLAAVGGAAARKKQLARYSAYLQGGLAAFGLVEVVRRFVFGDGVPDVATMIVVASLTLLGNVATLLVLRRARGGSPGEAHVEASWIFTSNDVKVNGLVIASALVVWATGSAAPDLIAGALIFVVVANGARRILALSRR
ncbi:MAG: cation transporter [Rhodothermaceae bacterium]|nr:cation transporter [Rhodothermaceae bacterium]MBC12744.1 cation transporter [Rhodothermaceae bacterium]